MSTEPDRLDARLSRLEGTAEQMNERLGAVESRLDTIESRIDRLDDKIDREIQNLRTDFRRWLIALFAAMTLVFTVVSVVVQLAL